MKLTHARVQNFRSILDTGKFSINDLCCLVGKNEAGKTATLTAIQSIRPYGDPQTRFDVTEDYPGVLRLAMMSATPIAKQ